MVRKNKILKKILQTLNSTYHEKDIQSFIDKLIAWYSVKFSDRYLNALQSESQWNDPRILTIMNFSNLKKRFGSFEEELFLIDDKNEGKVVLQKYLVMMAGWGLIYYRKSTPQYGYYRAVQLLKDFNSAYLWNLSPTIYQEVLNRDYSPDNEENIQLIEQKKKERNERHSSKIRRKRKK